MNEWMDIGMHHVNALLSKDADFRELMKQLTVAQKHYQAVLEKLPPDEQKIIENYIALCEEVEYQRAITAYYCGKRNG